jgi:hypothetical protein
MIAPVKTPAKRKQPKYQNTSGKRIVKINKKTPGDQNKAERDDHEDRKDEQMDKTGFANEPLREEDIDSLFMM